MVTLAIQAEETLVAALEEIAQRKQTSVEDVAREALQHYLEAQSAQPKPYSFIGIGHSSKGNISTQVETILEQAANRREGWSRI